MGRKARRIEELEIEVDRLRGVLAAQKADFGVAEAIRDLALRARDVAREACSLLGAEINELTDQVTALGEDNFTLREALADERQIVECFKFLADRRKEKLRACQADRSVLSEQLLAATNRTTLLEKVIEDTNDSWLSAIRARDYWRDLYSRSATERIEAAFLLGIDDSPGCTD